MFWHVFHDFGEICRIKLDGILGKYLTEWKKYAKIVVEKYNFD